MKAEKPKKHPIILDNDFLPLRISPGQDLAIWGVVTGI
jgi:hypothetical protein